MWPVGLIWSSGNEACSRLFVCVLDLLLSCLVLSAFRKLVLGVRLIKMTNFGTSLYVFKIRKLVNLIWEIGLNGTSFCFSDLLIFDNMDVSKVRQFGCEIQLDLEPF